MPVGGNLRKKKSQERRMLEIRFSKAGRWSVLKALDSEYMVLSNRTAKYVFEKMDEDHLQSQ